MPPQTDDSWRASRGKRWQVAAIGRLGPPLIEALAGTWRWQVEGREHVDAVWSGPRPPILALWHGRILPAIPFFRDRGLVAIASENFDGEWIGRVMARFGYRTARGSTSRGGARALVQLRRELGEGHGVAFTVDGPRGPARRVQPGCVWLASVTGHPILPFHIEATSAWTARSWDRAQIPKPFATVCICVGAPVDVPASTGGQELEHYRLDLERALLSLVDRAGALARKPKAKG